MSVRDEGLKTPGALFPETRVAKDGFCPRLGLFPQSGRKRRPLPAPCDLHDSTSPPRDARLTSVSGALPSGSERRAVPVLPASCFAEFEPLEGAEAAAASQPARLPATSSRRRVRRGLRGRRPGLSSPRLRGVAPSRFPAGVSQDTCWFPHFRRGKGPPCLALPFGVQVSRLTFEVGSGRSFLFRTSPP